MKGQRPFEGGKPRAGRAGSRLVSLAGRSAWLIIGFALSTCGGDDMEGRPTRPDKPRRLAVTVEQPPDTLPAPPPPAPRPTRSSLQFDLICDVRGEVVAQEYPIWGGNRPYLGQTWRYPNQRDIVDLESMRFCDPVACRRFGPTPIISVTSEEIVFHREDFIETTVRRRDLRYRSRFEDMGQTSVISGYCRMEPFSGFPLVERRYW